MQATINNQQSAIYNLQFRDRPIFICGHPKSGTSLVRAIFDSHPQLVVYPEETVFFRRFLPQAAGLDLAGQIELAEQLLIHIFTWNQYSPVPSQEDYPGRDYSAVSYDAVRQVMGQLLQEEYRHSGDVLSAAVLAFGQVSYQQSSPTKPGQAISDQQPAPRYWVEKSPYNEYYADQIFAWWPEAHCIHVVRDPRDNYVSYRRKHPDWQPEFFAANWKRSTQAGVDNWQRFGAERYHILRYEDLTQAPEDNLKALIDFLGIDWDPALTAPTRAGEQWRGNSMFANQFDRISAAPVARWKESLSPADTAVIELLSQPVFDHFRYPKASPTPSFAARWRATTWPVRRRFAKHRSNG